MLYPIKMNTVQRSRHSFRCAPPEPTEQHGHKSSEPNIVFGFQDKPSRPNSFVNPNLFTEFCGHSHNYDYSHTVVGILKSAMVLVENSVGVCCTTIRSAPITHDMLVDVISSDNKKQLFSNIVMKSPIPSPKDNDLCVTVYKLLDNLAEIQNKEYKLLVQLRKVFEKMWQIFEQTDLSKNLKVKNCADIKSTMLPLKKIGIKGSVTKSLNQMFSELYTICQK